MPLNNAQRPDKAQAPNYAAAAISIGGLLLLLALLLELLYGKFNRPSHGNVLVLTAVVLVSDACLLFAWRRGDTAVFMLATVGILVALVSNYWALFYASETFF